MALAKQTLTLIFISSMIIFATCTNDHTTPSAGPTTPDTEKDTPEKPLPDVTGAPPEPSDGTDAGVANVVAKKMKAVEKKINAFNESLKERPGTSYGTQECVSECDEVFGAAIDDIKNTLDGLESQNLMKANFDASAVSTNVDKRSDCFKEMVGGDPEVEKLGDWVQKITGDALEVLQKATN